MSSQDWCYASPQRHHQEVVLFRTSYVVSTTGMNPKDEPQGQGPVLQRSLCDVIQQSRMVRSDHMVCIACTECSALAQMHVCCAKFIVQKIMQRNSRAS